MITPALRYSLTNLVHPFYVPGSQLLLNPDIYVTVIAWTPFIAEGNFYLTNLVISRVDF